MQFHLAELLEVFIERIDGPIAIGRGNGDLAFFANAIDNGRKLKIHSRFLGLDEDIFRIDENGNACAGEFVPLVTSLSLFFVICGEAIYRRAAGYRDLRSPVLNW